MYRRITAICAGLATLCLGCSAASEPDVVVEIKNVYGFYDIIVPDSSCPLPVGTNSRVDAGKYRQYGMGSVRMFALEGIPRYGDIKNMADTILTTPAGKKIRVPFVSFLFPAPQMGREIVPESPSADISQVDESFFAHYSISATDEYVEYIYRGSRDVPHIFAEHIADYRNDAVFRVYYDISHRTSCGNISPSYLHILQLPPVSMRTESNYYRELTGDTAKNAEEYEKLRLFALDFHMLENTLHMRR